ncbi:MAG: heme lyase CcmF/NrfE family subunit [Metallibacterium scheffleri]|jgi:cytochrome c-type biogenesis protein CcmF|uniref:heme lyase CcmF/NrfE family subunit n=1 Tax=Metallibacterium scheffleri TaxID=993689 RepID=UPI0026EA08F2|nr:heme lyase CcmF/NrfE family subunit [Metallibacterium scheffleri]MCK9365659.1 heme lyase CcmF/NrfE family subunit [Metallibacterium scheffleri]
MMPELGQVALILALLLATVQAVFPLLGAWRGSPALIRMARPAAAGQFVFVALAYAVLTHAFLVNDFSVAYVAQNSNLTLPWYYRLSAVWGAHSGSLLLWVMILNFWTLAVALFSRRLPEVFAARVLGVMGLVSVGFLAFMVITSNPFLRLLPAPANGMDLNPVLQDPGLVIHPPMLYMGYVGFSVAFAFAIAALLGGALDDIWVRWARPWTNAAFGFLSAGIVMGSWWSYAELGWGGWWFWDPVENASFMPWLVGAALIHAQAVTEKRGGLRAWTLLLSIFAFSLSLLGTFLVRSGLLTSVHAFASDPRQGAYLLILLAIAIGGSLLLYALRAPKVVGGKPFALASRETLIVIGNLMFVVSGAMVLIGTLYPIIGDALHLGRVSIGPPYFGPLFIVMMAPIVLLLPFGPFARWGRADLREWKRVGIISALAAIFGGGLFAWAASGGMPTWQAWLGGISSAWVFAGVAQYAWKRWTAVRAGRRYPAELAGMLLGHFGVGVFLAGALLTNSLSVERDVRLAPGQSAQIGSYSYQFDGVIDVRGPNWIAHQGTVVVSQDGHKVAVLHPQKREYSGGIVQTKAAVSAGLFRDLYVALGEGLGTHGAWALRLYDKPFVRWVWLGGLFIALGGFVTLLDRRFRVRATAADADADAGDERTLTPRKLREADA